jgi:hypothetical protein
MLFILIGNNRCSFVCKKEVTGYLQTKIDNLLKMTKKYLH